MMRQVSSPVRRGAGRKGQEMDLARGLPSDKRRHMRTSQRMLIGLSQKGHVVGTETYCFSVTDTQHYRRIEST